MSVVEDYEIVNNVDVSCAHTLQNINKSDPAFSWSVNTIIEI